jgi:SAM-dependent methyltransferase
MIKSNESIDYIGDELDLFKKALNWKNYFSKKISKSVHGDILEVGAGIGVNTKFLARNPEKISSWTLIEPDEKLAIQIKDNISKVNVDNKRIINGTINTVLDKRFDTIIYIDVLEHIKESKKEIALAKQCLKPNGHLIILVPAYNFLFNTFDKKIGHYRRYDKKMLLKDINSELSVVNLFYLDSVGFFASLINKVILKKELPSLANISLWDNYMIPLSKISDKLFFNSFGKSLIGVFRNDQYK